MRLRGGIKKDSLIATYTYHQSWDFFFSTATAAAEVTAINAIMAGRLLLSPVATVPLPGSDTGTETVG